MNIETSSRSPQGRQSLQRIWALLPTRRRKQLGLLLILLVLSVLSEAATVTMVVPLIDALASPDRVPGFIRGLFEVLGVRKNDDLRVSMALLFVILVLFSAAVRLLYLWASMRLSFAIGADFTETAFRKTLALPYAEQTRLNSSDLLTSLMIKMQQLVVRGVVPFLSAAGAFVLAITIVGTLFVITPEVTVLLVLLVLAFVGLIVLGLWSPLRRTGEMVAKLQPQLTERMQVARGGIREIILDGTQQFFALELAHTQRELRNYQARGTFLSSSPRLFMEAGFMLTIIGLALWTFRNADDPATVIPQLSIVAVGAMKILPAAQLLVQNWATIRNGRAMVNDALDLVEIRPRSGDEEVAPNSTIEGPILSHDICLKDVWFRYSDDAPYILRGVDLTIRKGERLGVIGQTGAGKSTLIDLIMGLLTPTKGSIEVDGVPLDRTNLFAWRRKVAHVPQSIYLTDASVAENIAFGMPKNEIRRERVVDAAHRASIAPFVDDGDSGFSTIVGERGVRISGGQRQRIGIARALYKSADLIVLDEATSALDGETEAKIIQTIDDLGRDKIVLMIAHRLATLRDCDRIIEMEGGVIKRVCRFDELSEFS